MVKFAHLLVLSALIVWLAGSGCIGNDTSKVKESGVNPNVTEAAEWGTSRRSGSWPYTGRNQGA